MLALLCAKVKAVSTVGFEPVSNVQNPDDVRLLIDEPNSPVTHAQPELTPFTSEHLHVTMPGLGEPFDGILNLIPTGVW